VVDDSSRHIIVIRNNEFYKVPILDGDALPSEDALSQVFSSIIAAPNRSSVPIGVWTSTERDLWAKTRASFTKLHPQNAELLTAIDSALFCVSLDSAEARTLEDRSRAFLFGDMRNRWFDKAFTLIVLPKGVAAINFEHAWGDGTTIGRFCHELWSDAEGKPSGFTPLPGRVGSLALASNAAPQPLPFHLNSELNLLVDFAAKTADQFTAVTATRVLRFEGFGREDIKSWGFAPDSFIQTAFQYAQWLVHANVVSTYESCSTGHFQHGRTEAIRSATPGGFVENNAHDRAHYFAICHHVLTLAHFAFFFFLFFFSFFALATNYFRNKLVCALAAGKGRCHCRSTSSFELGCGFA
jgi:carnitine O-palmitoyltransferase 2